MGEAGSDIAYNISKQAKKVYISLRNGSSGWCVPRETETGQPRDLLTSKILWGIPRSYSSWVSNGLILRDVYSKNPLLKATGEYNKNVLAKSGQGVFSTPGTKSNTFIRALVENDAELVPEVLQILPKNQVQLKDGRVMNIDIIFQVTGFTRNLDFMQPEKFDKTLVDSLEKIQDVRQLFLHCYDPDIGTDLFYAGIARPTFGSQPPLGELQARLYIKWLRNPLAIPSKDILARCINSDTIDEENQFLAWKHERSLVDYVKYSRKIARHIGCYPGSFENVLLMNTGVTTKHFLFWKIMLIICVFLYSANIFRTTAFMVIAMLLILGSYRMYL